MRVTICILLCLSFLFLSGCGGIYENYQEMEQLLVIETLGLDSIPGGVRLTLSSSGGKGGREPALLTGSGENIEKALEQIRRLSFEEALFIKQTECILIGEAAARRHLGDYLSYVCRSPEMRIDTPVYVVRDGSAAELMTGSGDGEKGISEIMRGVREYMSGRGDGRCFTALEISRNLLDRGSALICALDYSPSSEKNGEDKRTAEVNGYAVIKNGALAGFLDSEQAIGAGFLMDKAGICTLSVPDMRGGTAALEISSGRSRIKPVMAQDGSFAGLDIEAEVKATVTEIRGGGSMSSNAYVRHLTGQLEESISDRINSVLRLSASLSADFAGLGQKAKEAQPEAYRKLAGGFDALLPTLSTQVSVSAVISHSNDMKGGELQ